MNCFPVLQKNNPEISVLRLGYLPPKPDSTIILSCSSTWISHNISNPLVFNRYTISEIGSI